MQIVSAYLIKQVGETSGGDNDNLISRRGLKKRLVESVGTGDNSTYLTELTYFAEPIATLSGGYTIYEDAVTNRDPNNGKIVDTYKVKAANVEVREDGSKVLIPFEGELVGPIWGLTVEGMAELMTHNSIPVRSVQICNRYGGYLKFRMECVHDDLLPTAGKEMYKDYPTQETYNIDLMNFPRENGELHVTTTWWEFTFKGHPYRLNMKAPLFSTVEDGMDYVNKVMAYLNNRTDENLQAAYDAIDNSLNP